MGFNSTARSKCGKLGVFMIVTPHSIANRARMKRKKPQNSILLVEGSTDTRIFSKIVDKNCCDITYSKYKDTLIQALLILEKGGVQGVIGIVDADYWHVNQINPQKHSQNLLVTDTHDIDTMILLSPALEDMLSEYATYSKLRHLGKPIREILVESGLNIGYIRWASEKHQHNVDFKELNFYNFTDKTNLAVNLTKLYGELKAKKSNKHIDDKRIINHVEKLVQLKEEPWNICQGHDLIEFLTIGLIEIFGNHTKAILDSDIVSKNLRLSYNLSYFLSTKLYFDIQKWEKVNIGFKVLLKL